MHWFDRVFYAALPRLSFFSDGWGDDAILDSVTMAELPTLPPAEIDVALKPERGWLGTRFLDGTFESPEHRLPPPVRRARFRLLLPQAEPTAVCVQLAPSGDEGFALRTLLAAPLLGRGVAALMLETAYYGRRRAPEQRRASLARVSDLVLQSVATVQETRALLAWLRRRGHRRIGVAGYSMGGSMAAMAGASLSFPVALVPMAAAATPGTLFCNGLLARHVDWSGFQRRGRRRGGTRDALYRYLCRFDVTLLPRPPAPEAAIVVATEQDGVVAPSDMRAIAAHWRSAELRWVRAGHMSTLFLHQRVLRRAIADAFERLAATPPPTAPVDRAGRGCGLAPRA